MGQLFVLCGPSGCGKTTLLNEVTKSGDGIQRGTKFGTRESRGMSDDLTQLFMCNGKPGLALGSGPFFDARGKSVDVGETGLDIAYALSTHKYGLSTGLLRKQLEQSDVVLILSDMRVIRRLKTHLPDAVVIYIASAIDPHRLEAEQTRRLGIPLAEQSKLSNGISKLKAASDLELWDRVAEEISILNDYWRQFRPISGDTETRKGQLPNFHTRYIDNITMFDHVILNYTEGDPGEMARQFDRLVKERRTSTTKGKPPIFIVAAASGAGKGTMLEMLGLIGKDGATPISKLAGRNRKPNDKQDGMLAIGTPDKPPDEWPVWPDWWTEEMIRTAHRGEFPEEYGVSWTFHNGIRYAVSAHEIREKLSKGVSPIFIANFGQFQRFRELFPDQVVFLYLFRAADGSKEEVIDQIRRANTPQDADARIAGIRHVHEDYIREISQVDHVLLNTRRLEDLYDQVLQVLEHYNS